MPIDHVLIAVDNLEKAGSDFTRRFGLASIDGGRHPGWGTANRVVPLGDAYLELIAVVDPSEANGSPFGRWIASAPPNGLVGWAVRTNDVDAVARRLGLTVRPGSRETPGGEFLRWRSAGVEQAIAESALPFFIEWSRETQHPGKTSLAHPSGRARLRRLGIRCDQNRLKDWLGGEDLPITVLPGRPQLSSVVLSADGSEISIPPRPAPQAGREPDR